jgi:hypothetical protein
VEGMDWAHLNEWRILKDIWADPIPNISIMPLIAYTWNSDKEMKYYTNNFYIRN